MREQLIQYVELLFAGAPDTNEIKQEILQNTLDRYDDLVAQGKSTEAAYRLAISGIGDINEILGSTPQNTRTQPTYKSEVKEAIQEEVDTIQSRRMRAVAVAMYILCPVPLFLFSELGWDTMGLCFTLLLVAAATALIMMARRNDHCEEEPHREAAYVSPRQELRNSIDNVIKTVGFVVYLIISFATGAWTITWLIFPIIGCIKGLVTAILDLKEANDYEA